MISDMDRTIRAILEHELGAPLPFDLSFAIPDRNFAPVNNDRNTLSCYLYDIRENRELRTVEPHVERLPDGTARRVPAPARILLSYCITAWSPAQVSPAIAPTLDEHSLLSSALVALMRHQTIPDNLLVGLLVNQLPSPPVAVVNPENNKANNEFWTALGGQLRPSLDYQVSIAMDYRSMSLGPIASTRVLSTRLTDSGGAEASLTFGGTVTDDAAQPMPIADAWVFVPELGSTVTTDGDGHFLISDIAPGNYTLRVRASGYQEHNQLYTVPSITGVYHIALTPI